MTAPRAKAMLMLPTADLSIEEEDIKTETKPNDESGNVVLTVKTSTDVRTLVIKDSAGNVITPDSLESFTETLENGEVTVWKAVLTENEAGEHTYILKGLDEFGYEKGEETVITVTVSEPLPEEEKASFVDTIIGFFNKITGFFKELFSKLGF